MALERPANRITTYYPYALATWQVFQNDRQQRQLALTALANLPTMLDIKGGIVRLQWAQKQTDELAKYRNLIVHAPMKFLYTLKDGKLLSAAPSIGGASTKPIDRRRLRLIKSLRFWKGLRNDLLNLNDYVDWVTRRIAWIDYEKRRGGPIPGGPPSWPHRPRLPSIRRIKILERIAEDRHPDPRSRPKQRRPSGGPPPK